MFSDISSFKELVAVIIGMINYIVPLFVTIALLAFLISGFRLVLEAGGGKRRKERKNALLWSVIALFVLMSLWGLVNILLDTFFPSTTTGTQQDVFRSPPGETAPDNYFI